MKKCSLIWSLQHLTFMEASMERESLEGLRRDRRERDQFLLTLLLLLLLLSRLLVMVLLLLLFRLLLPSRSILPCIRVVHICMTNICLNTECPGPTVQFHWYALLEIRFYPFHCSYSSRKSNYLTINRWFTTNEEKNYKDTFMGCNFLRKGVLVLKVVYLYNKKIKNILWQNL